MLNLFQNLIYTCIHTHTTHSTNHFTDTLQNPLHPLSLVHFILEENIYGIDFKKIHLVQLILDTNYTTHLIDITILPNLIHTHISVEVDEPNHFIRRKDLILEKENFVDISIDDKK